MIEPLPYHHGVDLICNENGKILKEPLPFNRIVMGHELVGDFFFCKHDKHGNTVGLTISEIAALMKEFS